MSAVNSRVTTLKFTKFLHDIQASFRAYAVNAHIEVAISQSVSKCQSDESGEFAIFFTKLVAMGMATSLEISKKEAQSIVCSQNDFIR